MTIGTLRETDLHAALKRHYANPIDQLEVEVAGYVVDILRADEIVEIQTHNFAALKRKLPQLLESHRVRLVHPLPIEKWIVRVQADRHTRIGRRKSPQRGELIDLFVELVSLPNLIVHPNFTLEIALIHEEEVRCPAKPKRRSRWKRTWQTCNRRLLKVIDRVEFNGPADFRRFIPVNLPSPFTSRELAAALDQPDYLAHKVTYCLRQMGTLEVVGKRRNAWLYAVKE
ncbi:MAG: hypothetical protein U0559_02785 [Anaerolineae bacterium]